MKKRNSILIVVSGGVIVGIQASHEDVYVNILDMDQLKKNVSTVEAEKTYQEISKKYPILSY